MPWDLTDNLLIMTINFWSVCDVWEPIELCNIPLNIIELHQEAEDGWNEQLSIMRAFSATGSKPEQ